MLDISIIVRDRIIDSTASQANVGPSNTSFQLDAKLSVALRFLPQFQKLKRIIRAYDVVNG